MDDPDIPMLDVGDFEVLDECIGEDENEDQDVRSIDGSYYEEEEEPDEPENPKRKRESVRLRERQSHDIDDNSGDNADNVLDVSIDVTENDFLESVAKDFSENIEDEIEVKPQRTTRAVARRGQPTVKVEKIDLRSSKKIEEPKDEPVVPRKKPGPKSKTMNIQTPQAKKPIQKINFNDSDKKNEGEKTSNTESQKSNDKSEQKATNQTTANQKNANQKNANQQTATQKNTNQTATNQKNANQKNTNQKNANQKNANQKTVNQNTEKQNIQSKTATKTPAFLKKDLTDEEIMIHFDEIENTVLTSDSFVIQNEVEQAEQEKEEPDNKDETKEETNQENQEEEENWDESDTPSKTPAKIKIEEKQFKESEMWYKEKIKAKEDIVEEKFTKLAKIIQYSYPMYKKWLDRNESLFGTAICKVESSRHSPLDKLIPNRWKFICNKKQNQQSSKEAENEAESASDNKKVQSNWQIIPGVPDANLENTEDYPPFVMRVVKIFEEFMQSLDGSSSEVQILDEISKSGDGAEKTEEKKAKQEIKVEETQEDKDTVTGTENRKPFIKNFDGLTILLRSNSKNDLMMHITGKNINPEFMDKVKEFFENGPGKDTSVKSVYCKTITRQDNVLKTNTTFLFGSEALDDTIGSIKIQLAHKANVWANLSGVEVLADVVAEYVVPTKKTTVLDIGCGTGLMSLLLASKCQKVIGLDVQKEIVEAEITCELNEVKNATFVTGKPKIVMAQIDKALINSKAVAVINTNNVFGRSIEVISALRKMTTLGRIVIITTLTKQAIRSILELTQPADDVYGNPFIPIKACIVDTTPRSYGFEIVMSMERRTMRNLLKVSPVDGAATTPVGLISKSKQAAAINVKYKGTVIAPNFKKAFPPKIFKNFNNPKPGFVTGKKFFPNQTFANTTTNPTKFQGKRPFPGGNEPDTFVPGGKKFKKFEKPWLGANIRPNPMHDKKLREIDQGDLREKLSSGRVEPKAIAQDIHEQKKLLGAAKEKLSVAGSSVDVDTVKKLQEMLNLAIEKTNKLESQLPPRSVWDRIAPPDSNVDKDQFKNSAAMKGRFVKETGPKDIIITTSNNRDYESMKAPAGKSKKYYNLPPAEPTLIAPLPKSDRLKMSQSVSQKPNTAPYQKPGPNRFQSGNYRKQDNPVSEKPWSRGKPSYGPNEPQDKWGRPSPPRRSSPPRQMRSPPRQLSPPRRPMSPARRPLSPARRPMSPPRRPLSPPRRPISPNYRPHSSSRNPAGGRQNSPPRRHNSPPRQSSSSRQKSPPPSRRYADEWDIPTRNAVESGWNKQEKEKPMPWQGPPPTSGWNQTSNSGSRYRPESDNWDNPQGSSWGRKPMSPPGSGDRWKSSSANNSNWDVQKKDSMHDMGRHDSRFDAKHDARLEPSRHEPRHESRHEPLRLEPPRHEPPRHEPPRHEVRHESSRWEPPEKNFRNEKDDWGDLPEDARDPWGDDPHPQSAPPKESRWNQQNQPSQSSGWSRDKMSDSWQSKPSFPINNMGGGGGGGMNPSLSNTPNMNMNMMSMNNPKSIWQGPPQQQTSNRAHNWAQSSGWQSGPSGGSGGMGGGGSGGMGGGGGGLGGLILNNWQTPQQSFSNFNSRPFNSNVFMGNARR